MLWPGLAVACVEIGVNSACSEENPVRSHAPPMPPLRTIGLDLRVLRHDKGEEDQSVLCRQAPGDGSHSRRRAEPVHRRRRPPHQRSGGFYPPRRSCQTQRNRRNPSISGPVEWHRHDAHRHGRSEAVYEHRPHFRAHTRRRRKAQSGELREYCRWQ